MVDIKRKQKDGDSTDLSLLMVFTKKRIQCFEIHGTIVALKSGGFNGPSVVPNCTIAAPNSSRGAEDLMIDVPPCRIIIEESVS